LREISLKSLAVLGDMGPKIRWLHSYVTDNKIYCVYLAPDEAAIREHAQKGGFPHIEFQKFEPCSIRSITNSSLPPGRTGWPPRLSLTTHASPRPAPHPRAPGARRRTCGALRDLPSHRPNAEWRSPRPPNIVPAWLCRCWPRNPQIPPMLERRPNGFPDP